MTMTIEHRRERAQVEISGQIDSLIEVLLDNRAVTDDPDSGPVLTALLARIRDINIVSIRLRDENDHDIADMERIVFGKEKGPSKPEGAEPA